jgi:hypothetical protein
MDMMFEAYLTQEAGHLDPDDIPHTKDPVWVLGKKYSAIHGDYNFAIKMKYDLNVTLLTVPFTLNL